MVVMMVVDCVFFHKTRDWNDGNFVFPIISTPNKLKKYFSCSYNLLLLGPQVWKIGKFGILKKTICRQLGEFLFLANVCSLSFLNLLSLWMAHQFNIFHYNNSTLCFWILNFSFKFCFSQGRMPPKSKRKKQSLLVASLHGLQHTAQTPNKMNVSFKCSK